MTLSTEYILVFVEQNKTFEDKVMDFRLNNELINWNDDQHINC